MAVSSGTNTKVFVGIQSDIDTPASTFYEMPVFDPGLARVPGEVALPPMTGKGGYPYGAYHSMSYGLGPITFAPMLNGAPLQAILRSLYGSFNQTDDAGSPPTYTITYPDGADIVNSPVYLTFQIVRPFGGSQIYEQFIGAKVLGLRQQIGAGGFLGLTATIASAQAEKVADGSAWTGADPGDETGIPIASLGGYVKSTGSSEVVHTAILLDITQGAGFDPRNEGKIGSGNLIGIDSVSRTATGTIHLIPTSADEAARLASILFDSPQTHYGLEFQLLGANGDTYTFTVGAGMWQAREITPAGQLSTAQITLTGLQAASGASVSHVLETKYAIS